ncbi:MAG: TetR/AcrR family transcriptional regulator [Thermomicrobiales bacterium]
MLENVKSELAESTEGRERLMQAAFDLFSERGYVDVPIHEIAEAAGMTRSAPYYHFRNKEELYVAVIRREITRTVGSMLDKLDRAPDFRHKLIGIMTTFIETTTSQFGRFMNDFRSHMSTESQHAIMREGPLPTDLFGPIFSVAYASGEFTSVTPDVAMNIFFMMAIGFAEVCSKGAEEVRRGLSTAEISAEQMVDVFLRGIR